MLTNLKGRYTYKEVKELLGLTYRMQVIRLHDLLPFQSIGNVNAYDAGAVNRYAASQGVSAETIEAFDKIAQARDIPLAEFKTLHECQTQVGLTRQHIHNNKKLFGCVKFGQLTLYPIEQVARWASRS